MSLNLKIIYYSMSCKRIPGIEFAIFSRRLQKLIPEFTGFIRTLDLNLLGATFRIFVERHSSQLIILFSIQLRKFFLSVPEYF